MYIDYWGLTSRPFELAPDTRFLYPSNQHGACLASLHKAVADGTHGAGVVGDLGTGKTTVAKRLLENLADLQYRTAYIALPQLTPLQVVRSALDQLSLSRERDSDGESPARMTTKQAQAEIARRIDSLTKAGKGAVIVLDDAHAAQTRKVLTDMYAVMATAAVAGGRLTMVLLGDNGLDKKTEQTPGLQAYLAVRARLEPLDEEETANMLDYRMQQAWYIGNGRVFTADAAREIHGYTEGNPRRICEIADQALARGMESGARAIDGVLMRAVIMKAEGKEW